MSKNPPKPASKAPSKRAPKSASKAKPLAVVSGVAVAAVLLGVVSYTATRPASPGAAGSGSVAEVSADPSAGVYAELEAYARRDAADKLALGRADAPVVLIEYADFKCGYCGKFARDTEPVLVKKYVDSGVLRIEWRNFPIFGEESEAVARASWAAGQQGRFWEFHKAAYAEGAKEKGFGKDRLAALAKEAGVPDAARFAKDSEGAPARAAVSADQEQGYSLGATSTPSFLINGRPIAGAQPLETFTETIEAAAKAAKAKPSKPSEPRKSSPPAGAGEKPGAGQ
ncbi:MULTISPECIES: DsbA family protein [Streptomyces]|uniref:Protein-disulfide isomerase n=1 Tax=Streptomyces venezuelae (strain ATCC 10712 / CBS 650.69 / DSM 40230 / JCM 4526 / NBRC 13096 / PD 04745) TaxID=953739 RepID=F2REL3_STRVP|nr:thioredoxin domain-containing protein [Streptomyces venezuelae]APE22880.1 disulfide bond formation protein DsbA [Streptomyces venezuelae]QES00260.1 disulfide bond formation protein DsbA [Streptomyces venezuelae ATCC 10712]CCA57136.1 Protein-disulfide isomerase [Streptomyces venezuelae ATCC 10712]